MLPIVVINAITADANVNLSLICKEKLQVFGEGQQFERFSPLLSSIFKVRGGNSRLDYPGQRCVRSAEVSGDNHGEKDDSMLGPYAAHPVHASITSHTITHTRTSLAQVKSQKIDTQMCLRLMFKRLMWHLDPAKPDQGSMKASFP